MKLELTLLLGLSVSTNLFATHAPCIGSMTPDTTSPITVHITDQAGFDHGCIEVPYQTAFTINFDWDPNHMGRHWGVDFGRTSPCNGNPTTFSDGGSKTCSISSQPTLPKSGTCKSDPKKGICFEYTVTAIDKEGHQHNGDPQVIVDSARGGQGKPHKK